MSENNTEYQAEYDKAMDELDAAASGVTPEATTAEPEATPAAEAAPLQEEASPVSEADELKRQLEEARKNLEAREKALQDTQRWAHENARKLKEIERQNRTKPEILESVPELAEVVKYVNETAADQQEQRQEAQQQAYQNAIQTVFEVHPDAPQLLRDDPEFFKAMEARREAVGASVFDTNPVVMIREITAEKLERAKRLSDAERQAAIEAARKDAEKAAKAKASMTMPGAAAGSGRTASTREMSSEDVWNMSPEAFRRMQSKVTGF